MVNMLAAVGRTLPWNWVTSARHKSPDYQFCAWKVEKDDLSPVDWELNAPFP